MLKTKEHDRSVMLFLDVMRTFPFRYVDLILLIRIVSSYLKNVCHCIGDLYFSLFVSDLAWISK